MPTRLESNKRRLGILMMLPPGSQPGYSYVRSTVVRWFSSGSDNIELVLIPATLTSPAEIAAFFDSIHGLFLHPDWVEHPVYTRLVRTLLTMATLANKAGDYFPVWGTCLGFQMMMQFAGNFRDLEQFDARQLEKARSKIHIREEELERSRIGHAGTKAQLTHLRQIYVPYFDHEHGISVERYNSNPALKASYRVLSTSHDRAGREYVSMVEGRSLPFFGTQFHPDDDRAMTWLASFFVAEMAKSSHKGFPMTGVAISSLRKGACLEEMDYTVGCLRR